MTGMARSIKLKTQPLRNPGQSLDEEIDRVIHDSFMGYYLLASTLWVFAMVEWFAKILHLPRVPSAYAVAALVATFVCVAKFIWTRKHVGNLKKGREGE